MAFKLLIKPIVILDAEEAVLYYNKQSAGLGKRFFNSFLSSMEKIQVSPFRNSFVTGPVRRFKVEKFPYKVFYVVNEDTIFIIGLSHAKRSNVFVKRRLRLL